MAKVPRLPSTRERLTRSDKTKRQNTALDRAKEVPKDDIYRQPWWHLPLSQHLEGRGRHMSESEANLMHSISRPTRSKSLSRENKNYLLQILK